ncbi:enoyl-CoA hydratase-related protein, partial [uncultured Aeromicrobium sp.]|uniref:enoyl-CoA hydratase-related protein n=1 Tax=uncultured Aeromicrobium sp. TaxID=337820 RepID=UPI0025F4AE19
MASDTILATARDGAVAVLTLQRPERRNALDLALCRAIDAAAREAVDEGARVLVVTGEGSAFCAGADLGGVYGDQFLQALYGMLHGLTRLPVPVIAAVNGPAIGAGTQLAIACDLRVADTTARFAVPTARNGMAVDAWTIRTLGKLAGMGPARRLMLAADFLDRDAALACG